MGEVITIHARRTFTEEEALQILPVIKRITFRAAALAEDLEDQMRFVPEDEPLYKRLRMEYEGAVRRWAVKVSHLGCDPRGVWIVDFNTADGSYSWRLGDESLSYFHPFSKPQDIRPQDQAPKLN